ncbi:MAG: Hsp20/alpha crystallin family protein [Gemmatimonadales bacterium]|nr:MAG: Hsp20/alpha crystallin family protein [Gemmatimonadales bacterium]
MGCASLTDLLLAWLLQLRPTRPPALPSGSGQSTRSLATTGGSTMAIVRYRTSPATLSPFESVSRLARLMDDSFQLGDGRGADLGVPEVDVEETTDAIILTADLPGFDPDQVEISVENQMLTLSGTRERVREENVPTEEGGQQTNGPSRMHVRERRWGTFTRSFTLPRTIRAEEISASFDRGVLTVHMPKAAEARSRKIEIRTGA